MRLEDLLNSQKPKPEFKSPGVFTRDPTSVGIRYNAPIDTIIDDGGISGNMSGIDTLIQAEQDEKVDLSYDLTEHLDDVSKFIPDYLINDPEVVGYPDVEMQEEIYKWASSSIPWNGYTIKDLGAGRGDFYGHLIRERDNVTPHYVGFESKESLVIAGRNKYPDIELVHGDYFNSDAQTDYTICIGTLNEDNGFDKWEHFNKTLKHAIYTTKVAVIFVLSRNMDGTDGYLDYPFEELFLHLPKDIRFTIDYTRLEDIYKLTVHIGGYND